MSTGPLRILAVSGSLRSASSNTATLRAAARLAPPGIAVEVYEGLRDLPAFDADVQDWPAPVAAWKAKVAGADALLISSPEYARGIAGSLKNALDWLVSGDEIPGKPVALLNTSPRAVHAEAALRLVLETMSARLVPDACGSLPLLGRGLDAVAIAADAALASTLRGTLLALAGAVNTAAAAAGRS